MQKINADFNTEYKDYRNYTAIMISTDRQIFNERSAVRVRMIEQSKGYKQLHIIIFSTIKREPEEISDNCKIYSTNSFTRWNYVSRAYKIGKNILNEVDKQALVLVTCQDPFETGLVGRKIAKLRGGSELLLQIHTDLLSPYFTRKNFLNKIRLIVSKYTLPHAQIIRVVSSKIANSLVEKGYSKEKIIVKPINVDVGYIKNATPSFDLKEKFKQYKKIVLMVSRLEKEKNIDMAIQSWKLVTDKIEGAGLVIVGSGRELNKLKKIVSKLKIESKVIFEGWQTDLLPYYKGCDLFLNTSWYEGYGMVFREAEAAGCKIISTDVGIARECGAVLVEFDFKDISEKIINELRE